MGDNELLNIEPKVYVKFLLENNIAISATFSMYCMQGVAINVQLHCLQMYGIKVVFMHLLQVEIATKSFPFVERGTCLGILKL